MERPEKKILIGGLRGSSGKTVVALGLSAAWRRKGLNIVPFKKGPDFVDAAWLTMAARSDCYTLDTYMMGEERIAASFVKRQTPGSVSVIEGNRGLFDGMDAEGSYSTAELAKLLKVPVVLVIEVTKITRTAAAVVLGCMKMDPEVDLRGVIINRVAGARHEEILRKTIEGVTGLPVLGAIPRLESHYFPERHLGLVMPREHPSASESIDRTADIIERYVDLKAMEQIAGEASDSVKADPLLLDGPAQRPRVKIGIIRDAAFPFYYPENIEELKKRGAELVEISALEDSSLPRISALYIGGGFPETSAGALADNVPFRKSVLEAVEDGLPVWAECGGAMYMGESLAYEGRTYPMVGAIPVRFGFSKRPKWHGYTMMEVDAENPYFEPGKIIKGHEFHYSFVLDSDKLRTIFKCRRGHGFDGSRDGVAYKNLVAAYNHLNDLGGNTGWSGAMVEAALRYDGRSKTADFDKKWKGQGRPHVIQGL